LRRGERVERPRARNLPLAAAIVVCLVAIVAIGLAPGAARATRGGAGFIDSKAGHPLTFLGARASAGARSGPRVDAAGLSCRECVGAS
jgi:hypothetical protein